MSLILTPSAPAARRAGPGHRRGEAHPRAALTDAQVVEMRALYARWKETGIRKGYSAAARIFGCSYGTARDILTYRTRFFAPARAGMTVELALVQADATARGSRDPADDAEALCVLAAEVRRLRGELAEMREQEPVAEWVKSPVGNYPMLVWERGHVAEIGDKLYARPVPPEPKGGA